MVTWLKAIAAVLGAAACLIAYLALTEEYERDIVSEPQQGRVLAITDEGVRYVRHSPGSPWDDDGDGWIGPYTDEDAPRDLGLQVGDPIVLRAGKLEQSLAPPTPLLLVGFVLCLLFAVWSFVRPRLEQRAIDRVRHDPIALIELMIRKTRTNKLVGAFWLIAMSAPITLAGVFLGEKLWEQIFLGALGAIGIGAGLFTAWSAWRLRNPKNAPVLRLIRETPQRIVWLYVLELEVNSVMTYTLFVCCDDGSKHDFNLLELEPDMLMASLVALVPHARVGYSKEREQAWKSQPSAFLQTAA